MPADRSSTDVEFNVKSFEYLGGGKIKVELDSGKAFVVSGSTFCKTLTLAGRLFSKHSWDLIEDLSLV